MTLLTRRGAIAGSLSALALAACRRSADAPATLAGTTLRVATYKGQIDSFFAAAGETPPVYRVAPAMFAGGNQIVEAINAGAIDVGGMSEIPPIFVANTATALRLIAVQQYDVNNQVVLVPKGSAMSGRRPPITSCSGCSTGSG